MRLAAELTFVLCAIGVVAVLLMGRSPRPLPAQAPAPIVDRAALRADLRAIVREELAAATPAVPEPPREERPAEPRMAAPRVASAAHDQAADLVARRAAARRWRAEDMLALRGLLDRMSGEERAEILATLVPAINQGTIRVEPGVGSPF